MNQRYAVTLQNHARVAHEDAVSYLESGWPGLAAMLQEYAAIMYARAREEMDRGQ